MNKCRYPACGKELPDGLTYCSEDCLREATELRRQERNKITNTDLTSEDTFWLGQERRKRATETILKLAKELLPMSLKKFASIVSYRTGLSLRKITDDYLEVLLEIGLLKRIDNMLHFAETTKKAES